jgi:hypothetical protein
MAIVSGGASVCTGGVASASSANSASNIAAKAFDGVSATGNFWNSGTMAIGGTEWLQYDFGSTPRDIVELRIYYPSDFNLTYTPKNFSLYWSDDGITWVRQRSWAEQVFTLGGTKVLDATALPVGTNRLVPGFGTSFKYNSAALPQGMLPTVLRWGGFVRSRNWTRPLMAGIYTGKYRIAGSTTVLGMPKARRVDLLDQRSGALVDTRTTGPDGVFAFEELAMGTYTLVGVDNSGEQNSVIYAHVTPVP